MEGVLKDIYIPNNMIISLTKVVGRGVNGGSSKIFSSSCEPPRAWAMEQA